MVLLSRCRAWAVLALSAVVVAALPAAPARAADPPATFETIAALDELTADHARLFRLYWAAFEREPDPGGALYWIGEHDRCIGLAGIADAFADSREFRLRYGRLDAPDFVRRVYRNVLRRDADAAGLAYWTDLLSQGRLTRGGVILNVSLSDEFAGRHPYPSDEVRPRPCGGPDGAGAGRRVDVVERPGIEPLASVAGLTIGIPSSQVERAGFHQSTHPGALGMQLASTPPVRVTVMDSRGRGTHRRGAVDVVVEPTAAIVAPLSGTVARAGSYTLYCRYRDGYVVIHPDGRPDLEVKVLHIQEVAVRAGQRVEAGDVIAARATRFPFRSQIDDLTGEPSWPHVHIEVVDPSVPRKPSSGRRC